jgi:L-amino acid N-acyltransferase YncA
MDPLCGRIAGQRRTAVSRRRSRRALIGEVFTVGQSLGLRKLCGMLTPDQHGAQTLFERLGFRVEAALQDWVHDRRGRLRDILVMTYELDGFTDQASQPRRIV